MDTRLNQTDPMEDALKSQPLAPMPRSVTANVMSRIQKDKRPAILTWQDVLSGTVLALCLGALWFTYQNLPPIVLLKIHNQRILLYQSFMVNARWLVPSLLFGFAGLLSALAIPYLLQMLVKRR